MKITVICEMVNGVFAVQYAAVVFATAARQHVRGRPTSCRLKIETVQFLSDHRIRALGTYLRI